MCSLVYEFNNIKNGRFSVNRPASTVSAILVSLLQVEITTMTGDKVGSIFMILMINE